MHLNADLDGVTISFRVADADRVSSQLGLDAEIFYPGWITNENPSPCKIGFYVRFEDHLAYADFHNLPFYYQHEGYGQYMNRIVKAVREDSRFAEWDGHGARFSAGLLMDLISLLSPMQRLPFDPDLLAALARIDFKDDYYDFVRAIDGDTLVVLPPRSLSKWMKDVHVRLYGIETPELNEQFGLLYRRHLSDLCELDGKRKLYIIWERERLGTQYGGFPITSFERGVGHVFVQWEGNAFYYVNGLMSLLRLSSCERKGYSLLRGGGLIKRIHIPHNACPLRRCGMRLDGPPEASTTLEVIRQLMPPLCLLRYPELPTLDPRDPRMFSTLREIFISLPSNDCVLESSFAGIWQKFSKEYENQKISPFDVVLLLLAQWKNEHCYWGRWWW